eukprot:Em0001g1848a
MPSRNRKKRSKQRAEYRKTIFYHKKTRLKPERATRPIPKRRRPLYKLKADPEKKALYVTAIRPIPKQRKKNSVRDSYNADIESKQSAKRQRYQEDLEENRAAKRQKYEDNSAAIKASERNR